MAKIQIKVDLDICDMEFILEVYHHNSSDENGDDYTIDAAVRSLIRNGYLVMKERGDFDA